MEKKIQNITVAVGTKLKVVAVLTIKCCKASLTIQAIGIVWISLKQSTYAVINLK